MRRPGWALLAVLLAGCERTASTLGPTREDARTRAGELLSALTLRFGPAEREPAFDALRPKLLRNALTPSRIVDDMQVWTGWEGTRRSLEIQGRPEATGYRIGVRGGAPAPFAPGEYRGRLSLRPEGGGYEWIVRDELAVGGLQPDDVARGYQALLHGIERAATEAGSAPVDLRPQLLSALPRAAAAFGRLYALQALRATRDQDGATAVELSVALEPARLRPVAARYASFLEKYAMPIELRAEAHAPADAPRPDGVTPAFWALTAAGGRATLRLRLRDGRLAPLEGGTQALGDRLAASIDYSTPSGPFRIGVRRLRTDVRLFGSSERKAFAASFRQEPEWRLPFMIRPLLRGSLRRPFEGEGSLLEYAIAGDDGVTRLERRYRLAVKESWIVRWIGGFTATAVSDFRRHAEAESDRFTADGLDALRRDVEDLLR